MADADRDETLGYLNKSATSLFANYCVCWRDVFATTLQLGALEGSGSRCGIRVITGGGK